jgi:hypothetical protein
METVKFIQLTDFHKIKPIYIAPSSIAVFFSYTVNYDNAGVLTQVFIKGSHERHYSVAETPEQIIELIKKL